MVILIIIHGHYRVWALAKAPTLGDQSPAHKVGAQGLPPWVAGEGCVSVEEGESTPAAEGTERSRGAAGSGPTLSKPPGPARTSLFH